MKYHRCSKACHHSMKLYARKCRDWRWEWNKCDKSVPVQWKQRHKSKTTLQRTLSASSLLETRVGQTEEQQRQARAAAEEAKRASECALAQAALLKEEQAKSAQQLSQVFAAQSESAQQNIQQGYPSSSANAARGQRFDLQSTKS